LKYDPRIHHRRSIRLAGYDHAAPGAYFVTLVTRGRECLFGEVSPDGLVRLNDDGLMIEAEWIKLPKHFPQARLEDYVVMPNHLHGIVVAGRGEASASSQLPSNERGADASPLQPHGTHRGSLGAIVQNHKSVSSRRLNARRGTPGLPAWQRNYYEHVVRNRADLDRIRRYIRDNPARWAADSLNPNTVWEHR
jgi:REP element-mobilizing transposase RayT